MFLEGRPPVNVGVTSNGDIFGGTQVTFSDVLGDKQFNFFAASISQYRTLPRSYVNLEHAVPVRAAGLLADAVLLRPAGRRLLRPGLHADSSAATRRSRRARCSGGSDLRHLSVQPLPPRRDVRRPRSTSNEPYNDPQPAGSTRRTTRQQDLRHASLPQRHDHAARRGVRPGDDDLPRVRAARGQHDAAGVRRRAEDRQHAVAPDLRRRRPPLPAARRHAACSRCALRGFKSIGDYPDFTYFGGNSEMRGYDYLQFTGQNACVRERRAALPADRSGADADRRASAACAACSSPTSAAAWFNDSRRQRARATATCFKFSTRKAVTCTPIIGYRRRIR